ncbi:DUF732 domain-containing protein [Streptomyces sp. NBC_00140]|uniref:DUF732 domain-containing protein n=1 Tax=Streptomyces sp. NBC_00140 TaxID=2975664 RepID=UPI00338DCC56
MQDSSLRRLVATAAIVVSTLALPSTSALAGPGSSPQFESGIAAVPLDVSSDDCGPPGASPGIFRCESQQTEIDGDFYYNQAFVNEFRAHFPLSTLSNNEISAWGHYVCKDLERFPESAVIQAWLNAGWYRDDAMWVVGTSENYFCPSKRAGDVVIPGA